MRLNRDWNTLGPGSCASEHNAHSPKTQSPKLTSYSPKSKSSRCSDLDDVLRRRTLLTLNDVEFDAVTLGKRLEAVALDGRVVDEAVLAATVGGDKAEAL